MPLFAIASPVKDAPGVVTSTMAVPWLPTPPFQAEMFPFKSAKMNEAGAGVVCPMMVKLVPVTPSPPTFAALLTTPVGPFRSPASRDRDRSDGIIRHAAGGIEGRGPGALVAGPERTGGREGEAPGIFQVGVMFGAVGNTTPSEVRIVGR